MLFNSFVFIFLFLPITLIVYFLLNNYGKEKLAKAWFVLGSLCLYIGNIKSEKSMRGNHVI
ncbi:MAG: hypothetical protein ACRC0Y_05990 [Fusobacteriaceae bacterium]